jgi:diguanylate cyclase (GGDEF)-like protein
MITRLVDMSSADNQDRQSPVAARRHEVSYVLVADADVQRSAACVESIKAFNLGVLVARDGEEALSILRRFGPPVLLITDLSLPRKDGFALIEAVRDIDSGRTEIIAWSALRELREFAAHRLAGLNVKVLSGTVSTAVLRGAIERALRGGGAARSAAPAGMAAAEPIHRIMTELADQARELTRAAGVAVYFKATGEAKFRAAVTWASEAPMPDAPPHLPRVFDLVLESGDALVLPDLSDDARSGVPRSSLSDAIRGLVAVPIIGADEHQVVGAICVFDVVPIHVDEEKMSALKALGRGAVPRPTPLAEWRPVPEPSKAGGEPVESRPQADNAREKAEAAPQPIEQAPEDVAAEPPASEPVSLLDRRGGGLAIARELARVRREQRQLSVILFDVDPVNRTAGSPVAASALDPLDAVSDTLTKAIRGSDLAIQWSRDELLVVLPGLSGGEARQVAERVRAAMQAGAKHRVAVAGGVAELLANETVESAVARANEKVRLARERGHNRVG